MFPCEFWEIFKDTYFEEQQQAMFLDRIKWEPRTLVFIFSRTRIQMGFSFSIKAWFLNTHKYLLCNNLLGIINSYHPVELD